MLSCPCWCTSELRPGICFRAGLGVFHASSPPRGWLTGPSVEHLFGICLPLVSVTEPCAVCSWSHRILLFRSSEGWYARPQGLWRLGKGLSFLCRKGHREMGRRPLFQNGSLHFRQKFHYCYLRSGTTQKAKWHFPKCFANPGIPHSLPQIRISPQAWGDDSSGKVLALQA